MDVDQKEAPRWNPGAFNNHLQRPSPDPSKQEEGVRLLLDLFRRIGSGYFALSQYRSQDALQLYSALPKPQQETPWVLAQMGRAYYEQAAYAEAERY